MIAKELVLKILMMCIYDIDPRFDKKECLDHMTKCLEFSNYELCSEYWEPISDRK